MITYSEANQARLALKMKLSQYFWYSSSHIDLVSNSCVIIVDVKKLNKFVKSKIPSSINGVKVKIELEKSKN